MPSCLAKCKLFVSFNYGHRFGQIIESDSTWKSRKSEGNRATATAMQIKRMSSWQIGKLRDEFKKKTRGAETRWTCTHAAHSSSLQLAEMLSKLSMQCVSLAPALCSLQPPRQLGLINCTITTRNWRAESERWPAIMMENRRSSRNDFLSLSRRIS